MIDLSSNENPYEPSESVSGAVVKSSRNLRRYLGSEEIQELKRELSNYNEAPKERILVGAGTDCIIREAMMAFAKGRKLVTLNPSFFGSVDSAKHAAGGVLKIQLAPPGYNVDLRMFVKGPSIILLDSPNNPTGRFLIGEEQIVEILQDKDNLVLIDEAYYEFSKKSFAGLVENHPNLAVLRSLDKAFSLAGLRVSYIMAGDRFLERMSYSDQTIGRPACNGAIAALRDREYMLENVRKIISERERVKAELERAGLHVEPSETNFLLAKASIPELALRLREKDIVIRDLSDKWLKNHYRISIGKKRENDLLVSGIRRILNSGN